MIFWEHFLQQHAVFQRKRLKISRLLMRKDFFGLNTLYNAVFHILKYRYGRCGSLRAYFSWALCRLWLCAISSGRKLCHCAQLIVQNGSMNDRNRIEVYYSAVPDQSRASKNNLKIRQMRIGTDNEQHEQRNIYFLVINCDYLSLNIALQHLPRSEKVRFVARLVPCFHTKIIEPKFTSSVVRIYNADTSCVLSLA